MGNVCAQPRHEEITTRASVFFKQVYKGVEFENVNGDICGQSVDAIVNPSNNQLAHNNGLSNALVAKGGQIIQDESDKIMDETDGILDIATAVVTTAGSLPAKFIIHVVSPIWSGGENGEEDKLGQAVFNALEKADSYKISTISVPCLSGGSFGFPRERCATIMVKYCLQYLDQNPNTSIKLIRFVNMDAATVRAFKVELEKFMRNEIISPNIVRKSNIAEEKEKHQNIETQQAQTETQHVTENHTHQTEATEGNHPFVEARQEVQAAH